MTRREVFACLDAISNRYGREAAAYDKDKKKDEVEVDDDALKNDKARLLGMGVKIV